MLQKGVPGGGGLPLARNRVFAIRGPSRGTKIVHVRLPGTRHMFGRLSDSGFLVLVTWVGWLGCEGIPGIWRADQPGPCSGILAQCSLPHHRSAAGDHGSVGSGIS